ncbi:fibronectin type III domain-containing protein [Streptomyces sp. WMMC897]|uniref:fibronectin type III domain-containing protein n=1 Tax=Streptomyces sp. WMMC897 TaxID=3014782 RepID=UPI0022B6D676|nr:fibronectin type III domain-containing protein [Streptomyces sp. WMMC897]MCZ7414637.1 fibronectin type III domain-containing protein [Streptomyces sp. WMMC897]
MAFRCAIGRAVPAAVTAVLVMTLTTAAGASGTGAAAAGASPAGPGEAAGAPAGRTGASGESVGSWAAPVPRRPPPASQTAQAPPPVPRGLDARVVGPGTVLLSWLPPAPAEGATPVAGYRIHQQGTATPVAEVGARTLRTEITGLEPGIGYTFTVRAVNAAGHASPDSRPVDVTLPE